MKWELIKNTILSNKQNYNKVNLKLTLLLTTVRKKIKRTNNPFEFPLENTQQLFMLIFISVQHNNKQIKNLEF